MDKHSLYQSLLNGYSKAYPLKSKQQHQQDVNKIWNKIKKEKNLCELVSAKIVEYKEKELKSKAKFFTFWKDKTEKNVSSNISDATEAENNLSTSLEELKLTPVKYLENQQVDAKTPAQDKLKQEVKFLNAEITALINRKESGLFGNKMEIDIKKKRASLKAAERRLLSKEKDMVRKRNARKTYKNKMKQIFETYPDLQKELKVSSTFKDFSLGSKFFLNFYF